MSKIRGTANSDIHAGFIGIKYQRDVSAKMKMGCSVKFSLTEGEIRDYVLEVSAEMTRVQS